MSRKMGFHMKTQAPSATKTRTSREHLEPLEQPIDFGQCPLAVEQARDGYSVKHARFPHCVSAEMKLATEDGTEFVME